MQHSTVTFHDPDNDRKIIVAFEYDDDKKIVDYKVDCQPEMTEGVDYGFNLFLVNYLLNGLRASGTQEETQVEETPKKKRTPRKKKIKDEENTEQSN